MELSNTGGFLLKYEQAQDIADNYVEKDGTLSKMFREKILEIKKRKSPLYNSYL